MAVVVRYFTTVSLAWVMICTSSSSVMSMARYELCGVTSAKRRCLAIGPIQDGLRGTDTGCMRCTLIF